MEDTKSSYKVGVKRRELDGKMSFVLRKFPLNENREELEGNGLKIVGKDGLALFEDDQLIILVTSWTF